MAPIWIVKHRKTGCTVGYWQGRIARIVMPDRPPHVQEVMIAPRMQAASKLLEEHRLPPMDTQPISTVRCSLDWNTGFLFVPLAAALHGAPEFTLYDQAEGWMRQLHFGRI